jgi:hypothetical protein
LIFSSLYSSPFLLLLSSPFWSSSTLRETLWQEKWWPEAEGAEIQGQREQASDERVVRITWTRTAILNFLV